MVITAEPLTNFPLSPPDPEDLYFREEQDAWIVSRHRDVLVALRSGALSRPPKAGADPTAKPEREKSCLAEAKGWIHSGVFNAPKAETFEQQIEMSGLAAELLQPLPRDVRSILSLRAMVPSVIALCL